MKWFMHADPAKDKEPIYSLYSEKAILESYWDHWQTKVMIKNILAKRPQMENVTHEECIKDWVTIYWAQEIPEQVVVDFMCKTANGNTQSANHEQ